MKILKLAEYFLKKYSEEFEASNPDNSFGVEIPAKKVTIYKKPLIELCNLMGKNSELPLVKSLHESKEMVFSPLWKKFLKMVDNFKNKIPEAELLDLIESGESLILELNDFRKEVLRSNLLLKYKLEDVIKLFQDRLHRETKDIENIHDLRSVPGFGTWRAGPGKTQVEEKSQRYKGPSKKKLVQHFSDKSRLEELVEELTPKMQYLYSDEEILNKAREILQNEKEKYKK